MNGLERYRSKLLTAANRDLRAIVVAPEEHSRHHPVRDRYDRVVAVDILHSFSELDNQPTPVIIELDRQQGLLLGSIITRFYHE